MAGFLFLWPTHIQRELSCKVASRGWKFILNIGAFPEEEWMVEAW